MLFSATLLAAGTNRDSVTRHIPAGGPEGLIGTTAASPVDNPFDNVFHVRISQPLKSNQQLFLVYDLEGVQDHASVSRSINDQLSVGGYLVKKRKGWATQREPVSAAWLKQGDNVIRFTIPEGADYSYRVKNIRFESAAAAGERLVISQNTAQYFNNKAYVKGFVNDWRKKTSVRVNGRPARVWKGAFEAIVEKTGREKAWTATVEVIEDNKLIEKKTIHFTQGMQADYDFALAHGVSFTQKLFAPESSGTVTLQRAAISIPKGAVKHAAAISITALRSIDIPALDPGMVNVTATNAGFRFLPHGTSFQKEAQLQIGYDAAKIPGGYTAADIKTYYFDEQMHHWVALPMDTVLEGNATAVARTRHFTDMINAIIKVPESPEVQAYNSTTMKGIKAANPTAAVNLINPPTANNTGTASIGYPINIPAGRGGMQPQLSISYNSGGGNGWMGLGWNLVIPSVGIDTRWGVPRFDAMKETETYSFNGEQLGPVAHRGALVDRSAGDKRFHPRVEGAFNKIIRHGNSPKNYWWEVIDKSGTRYYYGGDADRGTFDADYLLRDQDNNIAHWALKEVRDLNGNFVRYHYATVQNTGLARGTVAGYQLYVTGITYTGHNGVEGKYSVRFKRDRDLNEALRTDVIITANLGFKQVTADLLRKIEVQFEGKNIRSYEMYYGKGEFEKTLLDSICEFDAAGKKFTTHGFDYFNDVRQGMVLKPFRQAESWNPQRDNIHGSFINPLSAFNDNASALSGTRSSDVGAGMSVNVGFNPDVSSKSVSVGGNFSYSQSSSEGLLTLMDINGDGLADKVYIKDDMIRYRRNLGTTAFGPEQPLVSAPRSFFNEKSKTVGGGVEANGPRSLPVFVGAGISKTTSTTTTYITEVNGDQLPDIVVNGRVYFNHINQNGDPEFSLSSSNTPSPIFQDGSIAPIAVDQTEADLAVDQNPLHDIVRMWQAPYAGSVSITGGVALIQSNDPEWAETPADGVRVAIQHKGAELWYARIPATDYTAHTPSGVSQVAVQKGDRIYFRVQSVYNGSYDQVSWEPVITYLNKDVTETDANNLPRFRFSLKEDFLVSAMQEITMPLKGKLAISGNFTKPVASDTVHLEIRKKINVGNGNYFTSVYWSKTYLPGDALVEPINLSLDVDKEHVYSFHIIANTNVDWSRIRWTPYMNYEASYDPDYPNVKDAAGKPLVEFYPVVHTSMLSKQIQPVAPFKVPALVTKIKVRPAITFQGSIFDVLKLNGTVVFTVKKNNQLLAKQILPVQLGVVNNIIEQEITVAKDEILFFEYHISNPVLAAGAASLNAHIENIGMLPAALHTVFEEEKDLIYGPMFRHWGQFAYNGNRARGEAPIDESLLKLSDAMKNQRPVPIDQNTNGEDLEQEEVYDPAKEIFIVLVPATINKAGGAGKEQVWMGYDNATYVAGAYLSSSRMGEDDITALVGNPNGGSGARAVNKVSTTFNRSYSVGGSIGPVGGGNTRSSGDMNIISDFMDMNGDRYPDIVTKDKVQYTNARGGFSDRTFTHGSNGNHHTQTTSSGFSISGSYVTSKAEGTAFNPKKVTVSVGTGQNSIGLNGSYGTGSSSTAFTWMDMNGDGLPDKVFQDNKVALNLGYRLAAPEEWGFAKIQQAESKSTSAGLGVSIVNGSIQAGVSFSRSDNNVIEALQDVNGDGLPDMVMKGSPMQVRLNTGSGFGALIPWAGAQEVGKSSSTSQSANVAFTAGIYIPLINIKITVTPSASMGAGVTRDLEKLSDMDGDGYPDYVSSSKDDNLTVARSSIGRTNLLRAVHRPLGALIVLDYKKVGNTYNMPNNVWTLSMVKVFDGFIGDGIDTLMNTFEYENGIYSRHEREFYGFTKVIANKINTGNNNKLYTRTIQHYNTSNYYERGILFKEELVDSDGRKYTEKENTYQLRDISTGAVLPDAFKRGDDNAAFVALAHSYQSFFEGQNTAGKKTHTAFQYDLYGNMTAFIDDADEGPEDDVKAIVEYDYIPANYIVNAVKSILVMSSGKVFRKRMATIDPATGDVTHIRLFSDDQTTSDHDLQYDQYGNLEKVTGPSNAKGQRMELTYQYDNEVHSYVTQVKNSYGYSSEAIYDFRFGSLLLTRDLNGNEIEYSLDDLGRVIKIRGPYEKNAGVGYTIKFEYHPAAVVPWSLTKHFDPQHPGNDLETITFADGLGRILQTKKDIALFQGAGVADREQMVVSGHNQYDGLGRITASYYPVLEATGKYGIINKMLDAVRPTVTTYDVLNRSLKITLPDGAATEYVYGFGKDQKGRIQFLTSIKDANGKQKDQFTNIRGLTMAVRNHTKVGSVWTSFGYNAMNEQVSATDDMGNTTVSHYDLLGRRISRNHPDAGLSTYLFDAAGNLTRLITANLAADSAAIEYEYEFNRLVAVRYPLNPENNVRYTYGAAGAKNNRVGRIVVQEDGSGAQEFFYGALGELVKNIRTVVIPHHDAQTFVTEWTYDTWNRLTDMTYADGEKVTYSYNTGGLLSRMTSKKQGDAYIFVNQLGYDKFEQRVYLAYGNGTKTTYSYEPERRRLQGMVASTAAGRPMMDNTYGYDKVNNILEVQNAAPVPANNLMGGSSSYHYSYDDLYRLTEATGSFARANEEHMYTMSMAYNTVGSVLHKMQEHKRKTGNSWVPQKKTTYDLEYAYGGAQPHVATHIGEQTYSYDANGNSTGWKHDKTGQRRRMIWDEENRLRAVYDNGALYHYTYDAGGERVLKGQSVGQMIYVNGEPKGGSGGVGNFTVYVNPYLVLKSGGYTKHYYIESQRILSKLGSGWDNNGKGPLKQAGDSINFQLKQQATMTGIVRNLKFLGADGQILTAGKSGKVPPGQLIQGSQVGNPRKTVEAFQYYYHPDHLGSSSFITDAAGEVYQHLEYMAFGETFVEEHSNTHRTPYLFNAKELDDETGFYYYGARYYDPKTSIWQSVDPLAEKYPGLTPYNYCFNNPVNAVDPDGRDGILLVWKNYPAGGIPFTGHAGVLLIDNKTGATKYYEYGRYDAAEYGITRSYTVPNVKIGKDGKPTIESLNKVLKVINQRSGKKGGKEYEMQGAYFQSDNFDEMKAFADQKLKDNKDPNRPEYSIWTNNCGDFAVETLKQDKKIDDKAPWLEDPAPMELISQYQNIGDFNVGYVPGSGTSISTKEKTIKYDEKTGKQSTKQSFWQRLWYDKE